jgi:serine phosphatase RsbU (regulator of sigma subunit)/catechol 2,3-dioxygenase-like lactoylglutathione lyase family enzyme
MPGTPFLSLHAVNVFVRDQDASLRFYVDQLGFDLAFDLRLQSGNRWVAVAPPDGSALLTLVAPRQDSTQYQLIGQPTSVVFVTEDVIATYKQWLDRGVRFLFTPRLRRVEYHRQAPDRESAAEHPWGGVFTRFRDVDGNTFALVGFDEVNREIETRRREAAAKLEAERRAAQELEIAKKVQARLFPQTLPQIATLDYAGSCVQARQVGGDYHDFLDFGGGRFGFVVADIAGKGIAAALLMANLQASVRSQCAAASANPQRFLQSVHKQFYENTNEGDYATLFFAEYDDRTRRLRYANCGHLPALLVRSGGTVEKLPATSTVLGLFDEWECSIAECSLDAGDILALYTDGITESFNHSEEEFGEHRLIRALQKHRELAPSQMMAAILDEVWCFSAREQHDDLTLIVARCRA